MAGVKVTENDIITVYQRLLYSLHNTPITKQYALTSLTKLSTRFQTDTSKIQELVSSFGCHVEMELQQRGVEYTQLFGKYSHLRSGLLERMPPVDKPQPAANGSVQPPVSSSPSPTHSSSNALLVLLGGDSDNDIVQPPPSKPTYESNQNLLDLLDVHEPLPINNTNDSATDNLPTLTNSNDLNILNNIQAVEPKNNFLSDELLAYDKSGLRITFTVEKAMDIPDTIVVNVVAANTTVSSFTEFLFQVAVPKTLSLFLLPPSGVVIPPGGYITQVLRITNPNKAVVKMRIRVSYNCNGATITDQADVNEFPNLVQ